MQIPAGSHVYLIRSPNGLYKIGRTKRLWRRLDELERKARKELELVYWFWVHDSISTERMLHRLFHHRRVTGEWFALIPSEVDVFTKLAEILETQTISVEQEYFYAEYKAF